MTVTTVPVPDTLEQALSPEWLTAALQPRFPGIEVLTVAPGPVVDRISTNARFSIECAATWADARYSDVPWLAPRLGRVLEVWGESTTIDVIGRNFDGPNGRGVPDEVRDAHRLVDAYRDLASEAACGSWCVIHGDAHVGNLFLDAGGTASLVDWQLVQRGMWYVDVGYHIASTLTVEERRRSERDLLRHYLDALASHGVTPPSWHDARYAIAGGMLHGFFLWSITTKVGPAIIATLLTRLGTAVADRRD